MPGRFAFAFAFAFAASLPAQVIPGAWVPTASGGPVPTFSNSLDTVSMAYDSLRQETVVLHWDGTVNQVYTWDGTSWALYPPAPWWGPTSGMAYEPVRDRIVLLSHTNNVWEWDRSVWHWRGPSALTPTIARPMIWDSGAQAIVSMDARGLWRWNGASWSLVPASAPPLAGLTYSGSSLARDHSRNVLVATDVTYQQTMEWNGSSWQSWPTYHTPGLEIVYAASLGGVVGHCRWQSSHIFSSDALRWEPATHEWVSLPVGGSPGAFWDLAVAHDDHRGRLQVIGFGNLQAGHFEYDPTAVYQPRTWTVGVPGIGSLEDALRYASNGDRIVVPSTTNSVGSLHEGVRIDCNTGVQIGTFTVRAPSWATFSVTGATIGTLTVESAGSIEMHGCTVVCNAYITAAFSHLTNSRFGPLGGSCGPYSAPGLLITGAAIVDGCTVTGSPGFQMYPGQIIPSEPAISGSLAAPLWVVRSALIGGSSPVGNAPALRWHGPSVKVVGASSLVGVGQPSGGMRISADSTWNGAPPPAANTIPSLSYLSSPVAVPVNGVLTMSATLQPNTSVFLFLGDRIPFTSLPSSVLPLGLDPSTVLPATLLTATTPNWSFPLPPGSALAGLVTSWQGLTVGTTLQLTNLRTILLR